MVVDNESAALTLESLPKVVRRHVMDVQAIDVHTHLLPPSHGSLLLFGIDQLLTYHYLVAELFMVMPLDSPLDSVSGPNAAPTADEFFAWSKPRQAELVFDELFIKRTPISEACRGVITVVQKLGLGLLLDEARCAPPPRRLHALRAWFSKQDPTAYVEKIFALARIRYAIMTNIPFSAEEAEHWMPDPQTGEVPPVPACLKPALRVDPLLSGAPR